MEYDIIVEGFLRSEELHGLRYKSFTADGDSNVCTKLQEKVPYECTNHIVKNYGKRLHTFKRDVKNVPLAARKQLTKEKIFKLQKIVQKAIYGNEHGDVNALKEDLNNGVYHVFNHHEQCKQFYCSNIGDISTSEINNIKASGLFRFIQGAVSLITRKADSLIYNETTIHLNFL